MIFGTFWRAAARPLGASFCAFALTATCMQAGRTAVAAFALLERSPSPGATVRTANPAIGATFSEPVEPHSVRVELDGRDLTSAAYIAPGRFSVTPPGELAGGERTISVSGTTHAGEAFSRSWPFTVRAKRGASSNFITVRRPARGSAVGTVFELAGRTQPQSVVTVAAANGPEGHGSGIVDPTFTQQTRADRSGDFSVEVKVSAKAGYVRAFVQSVATDGSSAEQTVTFPFAAH